jgi:arginyl-tRNA synthetase
VAAVTGLSLLVEGAVGAALARILPGPPAAADPAVRRSERADFQSTAPLALAKSTGRPPRDLAGVAVTAPRGSRNCQHSHIKCLSLMKV